MVGATFHGYSSDITRTFLPQRTDIDECSRDSSLRDLWTAVYNAQSAAISAMTTSHSCSEIDLTAREVIANAGFGEYFTHRLGHGLGIEAHERSADLLEI